MSQIRTMRLFILASFLFLLSTSANAESSSRAIRWLSSPTGVATITLVYAIANGTGNMLWALDWTRFGYSDETSKRIQEANGIATGIETILFAGFFPFWAYQYSKYYSPSVQIASQSNEQI